MTLYSDEKSLVFNPASLHQLVVRLNYETNERELGLPNGDVFYQDHDGQPMVALTLPKRAWQTGLLNYRVVVAGSMFHGIAEGKPGRGNDRTVQSVGR